MRPSDLRGLANPANLAWSLADLTFKVLFRTLRLIYVDFTQWLLGLLGRRVVGIEVWYVRNRAFKLAVFIPGLLGTLLLWNTLFSLLGPQYWQGPKPIFNLIGALASYSLALIFIWLYSRRRQ